jgi:hypothetical protein
MKSAIVVARPNPVGLDMGKNEYRTATRGPFRDETFAGNKEDYLLR